MPTFANENELLDWFRGFMTNAQLQKLTLADAVGMCRCYYEGLQWLRMGQPLPGGYNQAGKWFNTNYNPDGHLRVTWNQTTRLTVKAAGATNPYKIEADINVGELNSDTDAAFAKTCMESLLNATITTTGLLENARTANFRRCIDGVHGVGVQIVSGDEDPRLRTFSFDPTQLTLDPGVPSRNLRDHDVVVYSEIYTADRARRTFAKLKDMPEKDLPTIGTLASVEIQMSYLSGGRLYSQYRTQSTTKGIRVHQVHMRDGERYGKMYLIAEKGLGNFQPLNFDTPMSPFGGDGLPLIVLHGHRRADSFWSIGDVSMMMDDQNRCNLLASMLFRQVQKNAGWQWILDKRMIPNGTSEENAKQQFRNTVGGVVVLDYGKKSNPHTPPQLVTYPVPQPFMYDMLGGIGAEMREKVFRAEASMGQTKSHVPNASFAAAIEQSDQILDQRSLEDSEAYSALLYVMLGTQIAAVQAHVPSVLVTLRNAGFGPAHFAALLDVDPLRPAEKVEVRKSSTRYQSHNDRKETIDAAFEKQAIDAIDFRMAYADSLDSPISRLDKAMVAAANEATIRIIQGEEWVPKMYGTHNEVFVRQFMAAQNDRRAQADPEAMARLQRAIAGQMQMGGQEMALRQPPMPTQPESDVSEHLQSSDPTGTMTFGDALSSIGVGSAQG